VVFVLKETEPEAWISNGGDFAAYLKPPGVDEVVDKVGAFCSRSIVTFHRLAAILPPSLCAWHGRGHRQGARWTGKRAWCRLPRVSSGHRRRLAVERFRISAAAAGRHSHTTSLPAALGRQSARDDDRKFMEHGAWRPAQVLGIEGSDCNWSLVSRLMLANEVLDAADAAGARQGLGFKDCSLGL